MSNFIFSCSFICSSFALLLVFHSFQTLQRCSRAAWGDNDPNLFSPVHLLTAALPLWCFWEANQKLFSSFHFYSDGMGNRNLSEASLYPFFFFLSFQREDGNRGSVREGMGEVGTVPF